MTTSAPDDYLQQLPYSPYHTISNFVSEILIFTLCISGCFQTGNALLKMLFINNGRKTCFLNIYRSFSYLKSTKSKFEFWSSFNSVTICWHEHKLSMFCFLQIWFVLYFYVIVHQIHPFSLHWLANVFFSFPKFFNLAVVSESAKALLRCETWVQLKFSVFLHSSCRGHLLGQSFVSSGCWRGLLQDEDYSGESSSFVPSRILKHVPDVSGVVPEWPWISGFMRKSSSRAGAPSMRFSALLNSCDHFLVILHSISSETWVM